MNIFYKFVDIHSPEPISGCYINFSGTYAVQVGFVLRSSLYTTVVTASTAAHEYQKQRTPERVQLRKTLQTICAAGEQRALPLEPQRSRESIHGADI
jgi:hypothetical protein